MPWILKLGGMSHSRRIPVSFEFGFRCTLLFLCAFPRMFPRMCGRIKQLSPRKITSATTTPSSSRTTTSSTTKLENALEENYMMVYVKTVRKDFISKEWCTSKNCIHVKHNIALDSITTNWTLKHISVKGQIVVKTCQSGNLKYIRYQDRERDVEGQMEKWQSKN